MAKSVLFVCTSTPDKVRMALQRFPNDSVFLEYDLDLLCLAADVEALRSCSRTRKFLVFPRRRQIGAASRLWWGLVRESYSVVAVLWCPEPRRLAAKAFAFLVLGRRILVFNENLDCSFLGPSFLFSFLGSRIQSGAFGAPFWRRVCLLPLTRGVQVITRLAISPIRVVILLVQVGGLFLGKSRLPTSRGGGDRVPS